MPRNPQAGQPTINVEVRTPTGDAEWPVTATPSIEKALKLGFQAGVDTNGFYVRNWASFEEDFASLDEAAQAFLCGAG